MKYLCLIIAIGLTMQNANANAAYFDRQYYFINGINTTEMEAERNAQEFSKVIGRVNFENSVALLYNDTTNFFSDIIETNQLATAAAASNLTFTEFLLAFAINVITLQ